MKFQRLAGAIAALAIISGLAVTAAHPQPASTNGTASGDFWGAAGVPAPMPDYWGAAGVPVHN